MLDQEGVANLWQWVDATYVQPEVERRRRAGQLLENFKIYQFRILIPKQQAAIVQFNEEVEWEAVAKRGDGQDFIPDTFVYIHELERIESVAPPELDGQRVAFIFFGWDGTQYRGYFDFEPNWPQEELVANSLAHNDEWPFSKAITHFLQSRLEERAARMCLQHKDALRRFGLWLVPVLIPYPLAQIAEYLNTNNEAAARELLSSFCNPDYLDKLVSDWWRIEEFAFRRPLIEEALWAHRAGKYHLSVSALLPHIEGIVVHWEFNQGMTARFRTESRIKDFRRRTQAEVKSPFLYTSVQDATTDFILTGPVLSRFQNWQDTLDPTFPNRHAVGHGRYEPALFTEEASIKVFLLLDTLKQLIAAQKEESPMD